ncbi:hypothetical protein P8F81_14505 [Kosakonia cowanii]|uniref:hypothetical protein n=1 Tax=Kosakonia cowanii TaxID=208223 RepID=UPI002DDD0CA3|nr:hypothetical protein [Kosakonia cowanii]WRY57853.1 hypothetical protein P8F81_14505 [Kosakonia cowanii]
MKNIDKLLSGKTLLREVSPLMPEYRTWVEVSLKDELKPSYPLRVDAYAMVGHSPYFNQSNKEDAKFKIRISSFLSSDIENEYDPSYKYVGRYEEISSIDELKTRLSNLNINLEEFVDSSQDTAYPL